MSPITERVDMWAVGVEGKSGSLANILTDLREVDADLDFILARREPGQLGKSVVCVTPLAGDAELEATVTLSFNSIACGFGAGRRPEPTGDRRRTDVPPGGGPRRARANAGIGLRQRGHRQQRRWCRRFAHPRPPIYLQQLVLKGVTEPPRCP